MKSKTSKKAKHNAFSRTNKPHKGRRATARRKARVGRARAEKLGKLAPRKAFHPTKKFRKGNTPRARLMVGPRKFLIGFDFYHGRCEHCFHRTIFAQFHQTPKSQGYYSLSLWRVIPEKKLWSNFGPELNFFKSTIIFMNVFI